MRTLGSTRKQTKRASADASDRRTTQGLRVLLPALALASFSVLSWNMLNFLIVSYCQWAAAHGFPIAFNAGSVLRTGPKSLHIWQWSTGSNLFESFAEDLLTDDRTWTYVRLALLYSYMWNAWMSFIGKSPVRMDFDQSRTGIDYTVGHQAGVPHLWTYFVLDQILPVSFAQHLFCTTLVLAPASRICRLRRMMLTRVAVAGCYATLLLVVPHTVRTSWFLPNLFALRILLFAPFWVDNVADGGMIMTARHRVSDIRRFNICLLILFSIYGLCSLLVTGKQCTELPKTPITNYAARALTHDMLLGLSGASVFAFAACN